MAAIFWRILGGKASPLTRQQCFFCDVGWDPLSTYGVSCWGAFHMKKPPGLPV